MIAAGRRIAALALLLLGLLAAPGLADDVHPNIQSGVALDKAFQVGEIDNINLFNGALTLTIPLGPTYPVGGTISYGLTLIYNANPWFFQDHAFDANTLYTLGVPNPCSNAGLGWHLSLGRLNPPCVAANETNPQVYPAVYEGPDGAQHLFYPTLHQNDAITANVFYTRDGSYLRLRNVLTNGVSESEVDFPDGTIHHFLSDGRLSQIRDAFTNQVNIAYGTLQWIISDSQGRSQQIYFRGDEPSYAETVDHILLSTFGGSLATYQFQYTTQTIARGCPHHDPSMSNSVVVPVLSSVTLPDSSTYAMSPADYFLPAGPPGSTGACTFGSGSLLGITLPTLGRTEWSYQTYGFPQGSSLKESRQRNFGVATRTTRDANGAMIGQWSYTTALTPDTHTPELVNTVTDPFGTKAERHFSVSLDPTYTATGWNLYDYGAQLSRYSFPGQPAGWYLSARTYDGAGRLLRSEYQVPDHDQASATILPDAANLNHRVLQTRTVYEDDGGRYADLINSGFDGLGHYRQQQANGNFPGSNVRVHLTDFNSGVGTYAVNLADETMQSTSIVPGSGNPWAPSTSNSQWDFENGVRAVTETCIPAGSTILTHKRVHRLDGSAEDAADLLTIFDLDSSGNVKAERSYGGDNQGGLGASPTNFCTINPTVAPEYEIDSTYQSGTLASSHYVGMPWNLVDRTIDAPTGLVAISKDPAGVATTYSYDAMGRLLSSRTGSSAPTVYTYTRATSTSSLAHLHVEQQPSGVTPSLRPQRDLFFDGLGRLVREDVRMPSGATSSRTTSYDALGRKTAVSELGNTAVLTQTSYDPFNRPTSITTPDGETTTLAYTGARQVARTISVGQQYDTTQGKVREFPQTTTEIYDRFGRLYQVTEPLGGGVTTTYGYDVVNRLASVSTTALVSGANVTQNRSFTYDRRGFLQSESHPEKGAAGNGSVSYLGYDSHGHATRKIDGPNDLTFTFDSAERLTEVRKTGTSAACTTGGTNCLKAFSYGTANGGSDLRLGKLTQAQRWNFPVLGGATHVEQITTNYTYAGLDGRLSQRNLSLAPDGDATPGAHELFTQSWVYDDLGHVASESYPDCSFPACTGSPARGVSYTFTTGLLTGIPGTTGTVPGQASGVGITYSANGLVNQVAHPSGVIWTQLADPTRMARPGGFTSTLNGTTLWNTGAYAYDGAGNVTRIGSSYYLYDNVSRIGTASFSTLALDGGTPTVQSYSYDPFGNLNALSGANGRNIPVAPQTNRLNAPGTTYDAAGNLTNWNGALYEYDAFDQLRHYLNGSEEWLYMYDADDERVWSFKLGVSPRFDRWTLRGLDKQIEREYDVSGWVWGNWTGGNTWEDFVFRDGHLLASYYSGGQQRHYDLDHLGSPRLVTNFGAATTAYHVYYPYGEEATAFNQDSERLKFTGHERDLASAAGAGDDLDYMHFRFFGPVVGRFLGMDLAQGAPRTPQSWNRYSYVLGNPLKYIDPTGEAEVDSCSNSSCSGSIDVSSGSADDSTEITVTATAIDFASYLYFVAGGFSNAFSSNFLFGYGRYDLDDPRYRLGQQVGDLASIPAGALEAVLGGEGEIGGVGLDLTGVGALVGVPVGVVSAAAIAQGGTASASGFIHFAQGLRRKPGSLGKFGDNTKENDTAHKALAEALGRKATSEERAEFKNALHGHREERTFRQLVEFAREVFRLR